MIERGINMYLKRIEIRNIKCFEHLEISFEQGRDIRRWTTLFGENGLGKSTLLQAIGVALAGPAAIRELIPVAEGWVRQGEAYGEILAELFWTEKDALTAISESGRPKTKSPYTIRYIVTGNEPEKLPELLPDRYSYTVPTIVPWSGDGTPKQRGDLTKDMKRLQQTAFSESKDGWLACGYGPFRRLSGGGQEADRILYAGRLSSRFVTLFREDAALTSSTDWLLRLHNTAREGDKTNERALEHVKKAFVTKLFPEPAKLEIEAQMVQLQVGEQKSIPLQNLSDGYRSMLALSIDLLRWLLKAFPNSDNPMNCPGVVLIDELDAHLHPKWQRQIGYWLCEKFPNIQFIIATHSGFLAQVAESEKLDKIIDESDRGYRGGNIKLIQTEDGVTIPTDIGSVENLRVDQIYQTELFDMETLYSPSTESKLKRHDLLHQKKYSEKLSPTEEEEHEQLSLWRENLPLLTTPEERQLEQTLRKAVSHYDEQLKEMA